MGRIDLWAVAAAAAMWMGCGDDGAAPTDAGGGDARVADDGGLDAAAPIDAGEGSDAGPDAGTECARTHLLVTTSDYMDGEIFALDLGSDAVSDAVTSDDQDTIAAALGCGAALLERGAGTMRVQALDDPTMTARTVDLDPAEDSPPYTTNPADVISVGPDHAYVIAGSRNEIVAVDPAAGEVTGTIDLSGFVDPEDTDGLVDAVSGTKVGDRVYVGLGRYWFDSSFAIHFEGSVLAVIDATTDALVDADPSAEGVQGIDLAGENPWKGLVASESGDRLWVGSAGDAFAIDGMIEEVDLGTLTSSGAVLTEETLGGELNGFAIVAPDRWLVAAGTELIAFDPGVALPESPETIASGVDGMLLAEGSLFVWARGGAMPGLRRFDPADGSELTPAGGPWAFGELPIYTVAVAP